MTARRATRGFTLIEVLIALAILGIAMGALLSLSGQSARVAGELNARTGAWVVATNLEAELLLAGQAPGAPVDGEEQLLGRRWFWQQSTEAAADPALVRVRTRVFERAPTLTDGLSPAAELITYLAVRP